MRSKEIVVRCIYAEENCLSELLEVSFRSFLHRVLAGDAGQTAFFLR